jgi:hypothetical protein
MNLNTSTASIHSNDFQTILRIHKKFLVNILKLSMIDHLGIQEIIDRILHICLRFIACCRLQNHSDQAIFSQPKDQSGNVSSKKEAAEEFTYIPEEEFENIQKEFYQQISLLFQGMKTLDSRGFLFRLDFNNYLSNQIMELSSSSSSSASSSSSSFSVGDSVSTAQFTSSRLLSSERSQQQQQQQQRQQYFRR